jgi:ketosteroid isomerase-like protein
MISIDATPLLALRLKLPAAGVGDLLAFRALFAHQHDSFLKAVGRYDLDQALERWTRDAIVWVPDRMPVCGRAAIRGLLADDSFAARGPFHTRDLKLAGGTACETGTLGTGSDRIDYLALWTRSAVGEWQVSREIWDI